MAFQEKFVPVFHDQKWFHLGTILSVPFTLPMIVIGKQLTTQYGPGTAICSIIVGNLILWLIGMTIISMTAGTRSNAIANVKNYLGRYGALFMWLILMVSFLNWFVHQIHAAMPSIGSYLGEERKFILVRWGAGFGFFTTLLSIGGIRLIKWATISVFPFVFIYYVFSIIRSDYAISFADGIGISMPAVVSTMLVLLPGMINLPTLFRHSRSKADSYFGLAIMTVLISFFEISTIWMTFSDNFNLLYAGSEYTFFSIATLSFISFTLVCMNLINIYYASACWETYVPRFEGAKGYVIIGLMGTAAYTFIQVYAPIRFFEDLTNCYLASLGTVLLIAYLIQIVVKHRPRRFEKTLNGFCWLMGCVVCTILTVNDLQDGVHPLLMGAVVSSAIFLCIIFIEETVWSFKQLLFYK